MTTLEDKPIKIIDIGQRDKDRDKDNRDREREWNFKNSHHINNNHQQSNHTSHVSSIFFLLAIIAKCVFDKCDCLYDALLLLLNILQFFDKFSLLKKHKI